MTESTPFLSGYQKLKIPIIDESGTPAWPDVFPTEKIEEIKNSVGPRHFSSQMMLEFIRLDKARLDPGALGFYDADFDVRTAKIDSNLITGYACYWDPSGGRKNADNSVCVLIYRDDKNRFCFIHDVLYLSVSDEDVHPMATQCEKVLNFMARHGVRIIGVETNGIGNALPEIMRNVAQKYGQPVIVNRIINHMRKEQRILDAIEPLLAAGRLFTHECVRATPLLSEMLGWSPIGNAGHDDGLDALAGALRLQPAPLRAATASFHAMKAKTDFKI